LSISIPSFLICWTTVTPAYSYIASFMIEHGLPCHLERPRSYISESGSLFIPTCIASEHVLYFEHFNVNDQWSIMVSCQANLNSSFQLLFNDIFVLRSCLDRLPMGSKEGFADLTLPIPSKQRLSTSSQVELPVIGQALSSLGHQNPRITKLAAINW
jgi:hypothetical protein